MPHAEEVNAYRDRSLIETMLRNRQSEVECAALFHTLAEHERNPQQKTVFQKLGEAEMRHAQQWEKLLQQSNVPLPPIDETSVQTFLRRMIVRSDDTKAILTAIEAEERRDVLDYTRQLRDSKEEILSEILRRIILEEYGQAQTLRRLRIHKDPGSALAFLTRRARRTSGGWIGDAIYGINDGLGAIFGIVSGVSGATLGNSKFVLLAGLAGMIASALSMGSGAFLAAKSERELYEAEMQRQRAEFEADPDEAKEEMSLFYQLKGVPDDDAAKMADYLAADPEQFLRTLATETLNLSEDALSNPITSALSGSISTAIGAFIPIVPFIFLSGYPAVIAAAIVSLIAHFAVGAAKSLLTVRSWWSSGLEMTLVGAAEGVVTYLIGIGLGHIGA